jgi:hypothetical protein
MPRMLFTHAIEDAVAKRPYVVRFGPRTLNLGRWKNESKRKRYSK